MKLYSLKFLLFGLLFLLGLNCLAEPISPITDSLEQVLQQSKPDTNRVNTLVKLAQNYFFNNVEKSLEYNQDALNLAQKIGFEKGVSDAYRNKGIIYFIGSNYDSALVYYEKSLEISQKIQHERGILLTSTNLGIIYHNKGDYEKALSYYESVLQIVERNEDKKLIGSVCNNIGVVHEEQGELYQALKYFLKSIESYESMENSSEFKREISHTTSNIGLIYQRMEEYEKAREYYLKANDLLEEIDDRIVRSNVLNNMGGILGKQKKYEQALEYYQKALTLNESIGDKKGRGHSLSGMGDVFKFRKEYKKALNYYAEAESIAVEIENKKALASILTGKGQIYLETNDYKNASKNLNEGLKLSKEIGAKDTETIAYEQLYELAKNKKNYLEALQYHEKYSNIKDSILKEKKASQISNLQEIYELEKKEHENELFRASQAEKNAIQSARIQRQKILTFAISIGLLLALAFAFSYYRSNKVKRKSNDLLRSQKQEIESKNQEKEVLLREIHHRVKNNLQVISSMLNMQARRTDNEEISEAVRKGQERVKSMALIHQKLYQTENIAAIEMQDYVGNLTQNLMMSYGKSKSQIKITNQLEKFNLDMDTAFTVGLIINELITNSLKYAFPDERKGEIAINLKMNWDGKLQLQVSDNGIGFDSEKIKDKPTSFGMNLVQLLTKKLKGTVDVDGSNGTKTNIIFSQFESIETENLAEF